MHYPFQGTGFLFLRPCTSLFFPYLTRVWPLHRLGLSPVCPWLSLHDLCVSKPLVNSVKGIHRKDIFVPDQLSSLELFVPLPAFAHMPIQTHNTDTCSGTAIKLPTSAGDKRFTTHFVDTQAQRHPDTDTIYPGDLIVHTAEPSICSAFSTMCEVLSCSL